MTLSHLRRALCAPLPLLVVGAASSPDQPLRLASRFLVAEIDGRSGALLTLRADHGGRAHYGENLLADSDPVAPTSGAHTGCRAVGRTHISCVGSVTYQLSADGRSLRVVVAASATPVLFRLPQWFMAGVFARGVVQYVGGQGQAFAATSPLQLFYTMDRQRGSLAVVPDGKVYATLLSRPQSGTGIILTTAVPEGVVDSWRAASGDRPSGTGRLAFTLYPNDRPYPAHLAGRLVEGEDGTADRDAALVAAYGSAAGVLGSYLEPGSAYPTLAQPLRAYGDAFTFFDPDAWSTVTTLAFSGDPLLQREARGVLERAEHGMRPNGQMPHHFDASGPIYVSIARSNQTGPNIFWTLAAIEYSTATGDEEWLRAHYPALKRATEWLLTGYDPARQLIRAEGPLFIDVFRREGFTLDTNMMAVHLLERMAGAARSALDADGARRYDAVAGSLRKGLRSLKVGDHYATEIHADGSIRDMVDYDGNFGAVAFGVPDKLAQAREILARLDRGQHTHPGGYGTWVSERRYDKSECYGENDGDSDTAMGRIWWLDMLARVQVGDRGKFSALLTRHRALILDRVWMTERIGADGSPIRAAGYHEYPEILEIATRELKYGIRLAPDQVTISPFGINRFDYRMGGVHVRYGPGSLLVRVPGSSVRRIAIDGLSPGRAYRLSTGGTARVRADGTLLFDGLAGTDLVATPFGGKTS